ncbi:hypothetical protein PR048_001572 [Dryococelus australis]|uniref:Uncharacterized protein n=1 Tax=Dryococelus australis TaxID=614101 RepID=A0ABQ9IJ48_9NEOP|nr:hypothetical protein PR048_001572 [Dryococelus australis]
MCIIYQEKFYTWQMQSHVCPFLKLGRIMKFWKLYTLLVSKPVKTPPFLAYLICIKRVGQLPLEYQPYYEVQDNIHIEDNIMFLESKIPYVLSFVYMKGTGEFKRLKCRTCKKFRRAKRRESPIPHEAPRLPYFKASAEILEEAGNPFLKSGVVVAKHSEPRSYLVKKDSRGWIVRRNTSNLRPSHFKETCQTVYQNKRKLKQSSVQNDKEDFEGFEDSECVEGSKDTDTGVGLTPQHHLQVVTTVVKAKNIM